MENAADALKMAAEVLLFLLALGITISSFSQARETADVLISYTDRDYVTQYVENLFDNIKLINGKNIIYFQDYFVDGSIKVINDIPTVVLISVEERR